MQSWIPGFCQGKKLPEILGSENSEALISSNSATYFQLGPPSLLPGFECQRLWALEETSEIRFHQMFFCSAELQKLIADATLRIKGSSETFEQVVSSDHLDYRIQL
jgi:hypothetical protein